MLRVHGLQRGLYLSNTFNFGLLTATSLALAFIGDVLLAPALMLLVTRSRKSIPSVDSGQLGKPFPL